jgi:hypothetical protein
VSGGSNNNSGITGTYTGTDMADGLTLTITAANTWALSGDMDSGTYTLSGSNTAILYSGGSQIGTAVLNGNKLTVTLSEEGMTLTFTKSTTGGSQWWQGRYTYGSGADYVDLTGSTGSFRMEGKTTPIPNITTQSGGNVTYSGTDIGDWLYICSDGTRIGIVVLITMGQPGTYGGFNSEGVNSLVNSITSSGVSFSSQPSVPYMSGVGWLWGPKQ